MRPGLLDRGTAPADQCRKNHHGHAHEKADPDARQQRIDPSRLAEQFGIMGEGQAIGHARQRVVIERHQRKPGQGKIDQAKRCQPAPFSECL